MTDCAFASSTMTAEAVKTVSGILDFAYDDAQRMRESLNFEHGEGPPPPGDAIIFVVPQGKGLAFAENMRKMLFTSGVDATYEPDA